MATTHVQKNKETFGGDSNNYKLPESAVSSGSKGLDGPSRQSQLHDASIVSGSDEEEVRLQEDGIDLENMGQLD